MQLQMVGLYFNTSRGIRQGCPPNPLLFILAAELLAGKIRQEADCKGISPQMTRRSKFHSLLTTPQ